jgi:hypothetical protein
MWSERDIEGFVIHHVTCHLLMLTQPKRHQGSSQGEYHLASFQPVEHFTKSTLNALPTKPCMLLLRFGVVNEICSVE